MKIWYIVAVRPNGEKEFKFMGDGPTHALRTELHRAAKFTNSEEANLVAEALYSKNGIFVVRRYDDDTIEKSRKIQAIQDAQRSANVRDYYNK